ncbi:hypothetical protein BC829DRAFT_402472 [Chytridium lagenaria]|nr:hypothetical protein BC829DRAFT_402472 [Chytridium lagenaria]
MSSQTVTTCPYDVGCAAAVAKFNPDFYPLAYTNSFPGYPMQIYEGTVPVGLDREAAKEWRSQFYSLCFDACAATYPNKNGTDEEFLVTMGWAGKTGFQMGCVCPGGLPPFPFPFPGLENIPAIENIPTVTPTTTLRPITIPATRGATATKVLDATVTFVATDVKPTGVLASSADRKGVSGKIMGAAVVIAFGYVALMF